PDRSRSLGAVRASRRSGLGSNVHLVVRRAERRTHSERSRRRLAAAWRRATAFPLPPEWTLVLFHSGGSLEHRPVRLRFREWTTHSAANNLHPAARIRRK